MYDMLACLLLQAGLALRVPKAKPHKHPTQADVLAGMAVEAIQQAKAEGTVMPGGGLLIKVPPVVRMSALAEAHKAVQVMHEDGCMHKHRLILIIRVSYLLDYNTHTLGILILVKNNGITF